MATAMISFTGLAAYIVVALAVAVVVQYVRLWLRRRAHQVDADRALDRLEVLGTQLRDYAARHNQQLPAGLAVLGGEESNTVVYRPTPSLTLDPRLILLHDRWATQKLIEFPNLRDGRCVMFCSGRLHVVSQEAFEQLIAADRRLRLKLGLTVEGPEGAEE